MTAPTSTPPYIARAGIADHLTPASSRAWFPGRWVGGVTLILGPLTLLAGITLRLPFHFFFPQQLAAFATHPTRVAIAYGAVAAGTVLLWPAVATLGHLIGAARPGWALWGTTLTTLGLFARTFHAGADHMAFQLVRAEGVAPATRVVATSYGAFHVFHAASGAIMVGWLVLAVGAYKSGTLGLLRAAALGLMSTLMLGVLKGSSLMSVVATAGLCAALVPLGVRVLRDGPRPPRRVLVGWSLLVVALAAASVVFGELG
jgi:hypothetical protein